MAKLDEFVAITEINATELEQKLQAEIDDRVFKIGLDVEIAIGENEHDGDWTEAHNHSMPEVYKLHERNCDKFRLGYDKKNGEDSDCSIGAPYKEV